MQNARETHEVIKTLIGKNLLRREQLREMGDVKKYNNELHCKYTDCEDTDLTKWGFSYMMTGVFSINSRGFLGQLSKCSHSRKTQRNEMFPGV
jgi:hypothetical protein